VGAPNDGRDLERAVWLIERMVLDDFGLRGKITAEPRKRIVTNGVPDEIDLYVRIDSAPGYESVFVFECKDRVDPSDKTDVETLRGKIERTNAAAGYLIARGFTKAAKTLAEQYPKMKLRLASDVPLAPFLEQYEAGYFYLRDYQTETFSEGLIPDGDTSDLPVVFRGVSLPFFDFVQNLASLSASQRIGEEPWPIDPYFGQTYLWRPDEVSVAGRRLGALTIEATIVSAETPPTRVVGFEVEGRGKVVQFFYRKPDGGEHMFFLTALAVDPEP
jgi:hypothetical protein